MTKAERIARQRNGLIEPHTVMVGERPYMVHASSLSEAEKLALKKAKEQADFEAKAAEEDVRTPDEVTEEPTSGE